MSKLAEKLAEKVSTTAVAKKPATMADSIAALAPQLNRAMPGFLRKMGGADQLARLALTQFRKTPKLALCTQESFFGALMDCAQLGLMPGPVGHIYMIPYKDVVTLVIGYKGILDLVMRSGKVETIYAGVVYEGDSFEYEMGAFPVLKHKPNMDAEPTDANIKFIYAVAHVKDSTIPRFEVMSKNQVDAIRKRSMSSGSGPWVTDYAEMGKKTVIKRLCKTLPLSTEVQSYLTMDETVRTNIIDPAKSVYDMPQEATAEHVEIIDEETGEIHDTPAVEAVVEAVVDPLFK